MSGGYPASLVPARAAESTPRLVLELIVALACRFRALVPRKVLAFLTTVFGLYALATPLLLWISWSRVVMLTVLGMFFFAMLVLLIVIWLTPGNKF